MAARDREADGKVVPLFGKDEMNLIEFPFGPITSTHVKTLEVEHQTYDRVLKREVTRRLLMTGSDKWGLPRPVDDQVLLGMKTLTHEAGFVAPKVVFSRYQLCRTIGWEPDGRTYRRLEQSIDRIAGTTFKFKDAWYDNGAKEYKSKTFHLITDVEICSRDQLDRSRIVTGRTEQQLCSFTWTDVIWKSFQDGFIRTLDMQLFRKIAQGRRREVPLRLFRILDKRLYHTRHNPTQIAKFDLHRLCIGTLGLCSDYSPSQMIRVLDRAATWLIECGYIDKFWYGGQGRHMEVFFRKRVEAPRLSQRTIASRIEPEPPRHPIPKDGLKVWLTLQSEGELHRLETQALEEAYGSDLERTIIDGERCKNIPILSGGRTRKEYIRRYSETRAAANRLVVNGG